MGRRAYRDIEIRGTVYATAQEAARALGVQCQTIRWAVKNGRLDHVGTGSGPRPMPIRIRGQRFEDAHAAARHFGVTPQAVWSAIQVGDPDRVGRKGRYAHSSSKPVRIAGRSFASMAQASLALGFERSYLSKTLKTGGPVARERVLAAAMRLAEARR